MVKPAFHEMMAVPSADFWPEALSSWTAFSALESRTLQPSLAH